MGPCRREVQRACLGRSASSPSGLQAPESCSNLLRRSDKSERIHGRLPHSSCQAVRQRGNRYAPALNPKRPHYICQACPGKGTLSSDVITALPASEDLVSTLEVALAARFSGAKQQGRRMRGGGKKANYSCLKQKK